MADRLLSAHDAEKVLGIPRATVRSWAHRHAATGLFAVQKDRRGVDIYLESDLLRIRRGERIRHADGTRIKP
jgi:hypothetical protein